MGDGRWEMGDGRWEGLLDRDVCSLNIYIYMHIERDYENAF